ncbi:MAG: hypothetical protein V4634_11815 [Pseudomonadota bacterium]
MTNKHSFIFFAMLLAAGGAAAQAKDNDASQKKPGLAASEKQDIDWISYRDVYRLMLRFEKYGKPKQLIQNNYQIISRGKKMSLDGLHVTLSGKTIRLNLPVDAAGRVAVPLLKTAYDENAELSLNRKAGTYIFLPKVSIVARADGVYDSGDLLAACEQALNYLRYTGEVSSDEKKCTGVKFSYARDAGEGVVKFRAGGVLTPLSVQDAGAFSDDAAGILKTVIYRFFDWPGHGQVITQSMPIAITALFD